MMNYGSGVAMSGPPGYMPANRFVHVWCTFRCSSNAYSCAC